MSRCGWHQMCTEHSVQVWFCECQIYTSSRCPLISLKLSDWLLIGEPSNGLACILYTLINVVSVTIAGASAAGLRLFISKETF